MLPQDKTYELQCIIGKGSFGSVYRARERNDGRLVAIKILALDDDDPDVIDLTSQVLREVEIMRTCRCAYILQYLDSFRRAESLWLVTELCSAGSLIDVMRANGGPLEELPLAATLAGAVTALVYLHMEQNMLHRDVKAGNLLLCGDGRVQLADFGVSVQLSRTMERRSTAVGTPHWMAPEVIQEGNYSNSADIWSLGITALELAELHPPLWHVKPVLRALFRIPSDPPPKLAEPARWSVDLASWLDGCLRKDPSDRLSAAELSSHSFLAVPMVDPSAQRSVLLPLATLAAETNARAHQRPEDAREDGREADATRANTLLLTSEVTSEEAGGTVLLPHSLPGSSAAGEASAGEVDVQLQVGGTQQAGGTLKAVVGSDSAQQQAGGTLKAAPREAGGSQQAGGSVEDSFVIRNLDTGEMVVVPLSVPPEGGAPTDSSTLRPSDDTDEAVRSGGGSSGGKGDASPRRPSILQRVRTSSTGSASWDCPHRTSQEAAATLGSPPTK